MPVVRVRLPGLLERFAEREVRVEATSAGEATRRLLERHPALEPHLSDGSTLRPHVRVLVNGRVLDEETWRDRELRAGDELAFIQAVSGG